MRVLLIAGYFPPVAPLAATRVASLARFLTARGHDVRVVAARNTGHFAAIVPDLAPDAVFYERKPDLSVFLRWLARGVKALRKASGHDRIRDTAAPLAPAERTDAAGGAASRLYDAMIKVPDEHAAWIPFAIRRGRDLIATWRPDVVYASAPPHSGLVVAAQLARLCGIPWIAELRDLWADNPYYEPPAWRLWLDRKLEQHTLQSAAGIVTVTRGSALLLEQRYHRPTVLVSNGFDADDYSEPGEGDRADPDRLTIVYTGGIYPGKRDPAPLFDALARMGAAADGIRVHFVGDELGGIQPLARGYGVERMVRAEPPVSHRAAIALQKGADVLLLLRWSDARERAVIPGKLFEYIGAGRPILCLGLEGGEAAEIVAGRGAGIVTNDPSAIAEQLARWQALKRAHGWLPGPAPTARAGLSREEQFRVLESFVLQLADGRSPLR